MILLLGGTSEANEMIQYLGTLSLSFYCSVTTGIPVPLPENGKLIVTGFSENSLREFSLNHHISTIIDATHPFAADISRTAMAAASELGIRYIRFERPGLNKTMISGKDFVDFVENPDELSDILKKIEGNILFTTGIKLIQQLEPVIRPISERVFVRVLPLVSSLAVCEKSGIPVSGIIALKGPFDTEFNRYCVRKYRISTVISKDSGTRGGLEEKIKACESEKCRLIILSRPKLNYPEIIDSIRDLNV